MNVAQIMAIATAELDACLKDLIDSAENVVRNHGGTEDEVKAMRAQMRAWLLRGGETLN